MNKTYDFRRMGVDMTTAKTIGGTTQFRALCPHCSASRKSAHQKQHVFWADTATGCWHCHNCGRSGRLDSEEWLSAQQEWKTRHQQQAPKPRTKTCKRPRQLPAPADPLHPFSPKTLTWLTETRALPEAVLMAAGVREATAWMPQTKREARCVAFPYMRNGEVVNIKYRDAAKNFMMESGCELMPYLLDRCLGQKEVVITEGEIDALSCLAAGWESVVSIPAGANANTDWLNADWDTHFADKKTVIIATDTDAPGEHAAQELIRRFGPEVCRRARFSDGCKDANDELTRHGADSLRRCLEQAKPVPLPDVMTISDFQDQLDAAYANGLPMGQTTGWQAFDRAVNFAPAQLALITGRSNDGKSEWLDELVVRLMLRTGWNAAFWTPENTLLDHSVKLIEKLAGRSFRHQDGKGLQPDGFARAKEWLRERVSWLDLPFDKLTLECILERARSLVRKYGIRILVLDPYNFIEKEADARYSENAWDSHVVGCLRQFAMDQGLLLFLVAHPRKVEMQINGERRRITMEDIAGTADFGNKADYCFCINRDDERGYVTVFIDKVRRKQFGSKGRRATFVYVPDCGRYAPCTVDANHNLLTSDFNAAAGDWLEKMI